MSSRASMQDYRGKNEGVLIHLDTTTQLELPIRDVANEHGKGIQTEPHYESGSFGIHGCVHAKTRNATVKNKRRYLLFGTRYQGQKTDYRGKFLIIGVMRIDKVLDVRKRHTHAWIENQDEGPQPDCFDLPECYGFKSSEMNFYSVEDSLELTEDIMREWGYKGKVTKQMKLTFTEEKINLVFGHFKDKQPINDQYIKGVEELESIREEMKSLEEDDAW